MLWEDRLPDQVLTFGAAFAILREDSSPLRGSVAERDGCRAPTRWGHPVPASHPCASPLRWMSSGGSVAPRTHRVTPHHTSIVTTITLVTPMIFIALSLDSSIPRMFCRQK
jgi:hypothetical protein